MSSSRSNKILVISYVFPPVQDAHAFRVGDLVHQWIADGHQVEVVTGWAPGLARTEHADGLVIHRVGGLTEGLRALLGKRSLAIVPPDSAKPAARRSHGKRGQSLLRIAKAAVMAMYAATWRRVYWPDAVCAWYLPASRMARRLARQGSYSLLFSYCPHFTAHLVALGLMSRKNIPRWVADYGDPFSCVDDMPPNNYALYRRLNRAAERRVFARADRVTVTCEGTRRLYSSAFPEHAAKIEVIPHHVSLDSAPREEEPAIFPADTINFVYAGSLHRGVRDPRRLIALFSRWLDRNPERRSRAVLHFFGRYDGFEELVEATRSANIVFHGHVPRDLVRSALNQASIIVNIGNQTSYQMPSKLGDLVKMGRPILNVASIEEDTSAWFLRRYPLLLNLRVPAEVSAAHVLALETFVNSQMGQRLSRAEVLDLLDEYRIERIAARYLAADTPLERDREIA